MRWRRRVPEPPEGAPRAVCSWCGLPAHFDAELMVWRHDDWRKHRHAVGRLPEGGPPRTG